MPTPENEKEQVSKKIVLNGKEVTVEELNRQREAIKNQKGARLVEVSEGNFQIRLQG